MSDIGELLKDAKTPEARRLILSNDAHSNRGAFESTNHCVVLDIEERFGLRVGDRVRYTNHDEKVATGYISHFFMRLFGISQPLCRYPHVWFVITKDGAAIDYNKGITPVIISEDGSGYFTHCGDGLPEKLE